MTKTEREFVKKVKTFWNVEGRHQLPWRLINDPFAVLVSEVMLQQTQVERVVPKYETFMKRWPSARALARAPLAEVLKVWQGLGYNSRAKRLRECALVITTQFKGRFPNTYEELLTLPGVGPYTAGAIMAFAFNQPVPIIETNLRTVYIHHFFKDTENVSENDLLRYIAVTLDKENPREWYWALMDYGAHLKKVHGNLNQRAKGYTVQSKFAGSDRQIRGAIIRALARAPATRQKLHQSLSSFDILRIDVQIEHLMREGLLQKKGRIYQLPV